MKKRDGITFTFDDVVEIDGIEHVVEVEAYCSPYDPGRISGPPEHCYPPEGGECEEIKITDSETGHEFSDEELGDELGRLMEKSEELAPEKERYYDD